MHFLGQHKHFCGQHGGFSGQGQVAGQTQGGEQAQGFGGQHGDLGGQHGDLGQQGFCGQHGLGGQHGFGGQHGGGQHGGGQHWLVLDESLIFFRVGVPRGEKKNIQMTIWKSAFIITFFGFQMHVNLHGKN